MWPQWHFINLSETWFSHPWKLDKNVSVMSSFCADMGIKWNNILWNEGFESYQMKHIYKGWLNSANTYFYIHVTVQGNIGRIKKGPFLWRINILPWRKLKHQAMILWFQLQSVNIKQRLCFNKCAEYKHTKGFHLGKWSPLEVMHISLLYPRYFDRFLNFQSELRCHSRSILWFRVHLF